FAERAQRAARVQAPVVVQPDVAIHVGGVVEAEPRRRPPLPVVRGQAQAAIQRALRLDDERRPDAPGMNVRTPRIPEVVDLEARRLPDEAGLEARDATAILAELDLLGVAREHRARRIDLVVVAGLLEVVYGSELGPLDCDGRAGDARRGEGARHLVIAGAEPVAETEARGVRTAVQQRVRPFVERQV